MSSRGRARGRSRCIVVDVDGEPMSMLVCGGEPTGRDLEALVELGRAIRAAAAGADPEIPPGCDRTIEDGTR